KEAVPAVTRVAVLANAANSSYTLALPVMQRTADTVGVALMPIEVRARDEIAAAIATIAAHRASALVTIEDPLIISNAKLIAELALQNSLRMIGFMRQAEAGALIEYGVDLTDGFYRLAAFVDKVLRGTPPADLPIERAVKFELAVNRKTAKAIGIELPTATLLRANEVIE